LLYKLSSHILLHYQKLNKNDLYITEKRHFMNKTKIILG